MEHPIFSNILRRLSALKAHTKKQHLLIAIYTNLLAVSLVSLQLLKQDACSHIRKRAAAVKEWYQNQDVLNIDNLTQCFWAILYKFSTTVRWSIEYYSKHLDKDVCLKTLPLFLISEEKNYYNFFLSLPDSSNTDFSLYQGRGGSHLILAPFNGFFNGHCQGKSALPFVSPHLFVHVYISVSLSRFNYLFILFSYNFS